MAEVFGMSDPTLLVVIVVSVILTVILIARFSINRILWAIANAIAFFVILIIVFFAVVLIAAFLM